MPRKNGLDKNAVVQAALRLLESEGPENLTLNRLAAALNIQSPSLYNHIDGMPGLLRELAVINARGLAESMAEAAIGRSGADGLLRIAESYRAYIKAHPNLYRAGLRSSGTQPQVDPELQAAEEHAVRVVLAVLASLGLSGPDALHAARGLRSAVHGFTTLEIAGGFGIPLDLDESFARLMRSLIAGFERDRSLPAA